MRSVLAMVLDKNQTEPLTENAALENLPSARVVMPSFPYALKLADLV